MWLFFPQGRHFFETPSSSRGGGLFLVTLFGGSPTAETPVVFVYAKDSLVIAMNINTSGFVLGETLLCDRSEWNRKTAAMSQPEHTVSKEAGILHAPKGRFTVYMRHKGFLFPRLFTKTIYH